MKSDLQGRQGVGVGWGLVPTYSKYFINNSDGYPTNVYLSSCAQNPNDKTAKFTLSLLLIKIIFSITFVYSQVQALTISLTHCPLRQMTCYTKEITLKYEAQVKVKACWKLHTQRHRPAALRGASSALPT